MLGRFHVVALPMASLVFLRLMVVAVSGPVCFSRQLGHVRKERSGLTNEQAHLRQERESTHGSALRFSRSNNRNFGEISIQERTRLWHD